MLPTASLRFHGLRRGFGRLGVLRDVDGAVASGELLLVTGPNGSGKSTLLRLLAGLLAPQAGRIDCEVDGTSLDTADRRRMVGYAAPDLELYSELTTEENLAFFARLRGVDEARARDLLDEVDLPHDRPAGVLSSGMRQRLRLAWALLHRPRILLLDEPLQNLDAPGRAVVASTISRQLDDGGAVVVANPDPLDLPRVDRELALGG